jgi:hypothetical protein
MGNPVREIVENTEDTNQYEILKDLLVNLTKHN